MSGVTRTDWNIGRLRFIKRHAIVQRQYGLIAWGYDPYLHTSWTVDVWFNRTLLTVRWNK